MRNYRVIVSTIEIPLLNNPHELTFENFSSNYQSEIEFAKQVLAQAPVGAQLHCHYKGRQLNYISLESGQTIALFHTYIKITPDIIAVKLARKANLAEGGENVIKTLHDLNTGEKMIERKSKKIKQSNEQTERLKPSDPRIKKYNGFIATVEKFRNPFKWIAKNEYQVFGDYVFQFDDSIVSAREETDEANKQKRIEFFSYGGTDLFNVMEKEKQTFGTHEFAKIASDLSCLLRKLHADKILHCDIKRENILLQKIGNQYVVRICDFDFSLIINEMGEAFGKACGTPGYHAPELLRHFPNCMNDPRFRTFRNRLTVGDIQKVDKKVGVDGKTEVFGYTPKMDIYALGITLGIFCRAIVESDTAAKESINSLLSLMVCYDPGSRIDLPLIQLALLLYERIDPNDLTQILSERNLPEINFEELQIFSEILTLLSKNYAYKTPSKWPIIRDVLSDLQLYFQDVNGINLKSLRDLILFVNFVNKERKAGDIIVFDIHHWHALKQCFQNPRSVLQLNFFREQNQFVFSINDAVYFEKVLELLIENIIIYREMHQENHLNISPMQRFCLWHANHLFNFVFNKQTLNYPHDVRHMMDLKTKLLFLKYAFHGEKTKCDESVVDVRYLKYLIESAKENCREFIRFCRSLQKAHALDLPAPTPAQSPTGSPNGLFALPFPPRSVSRSANNSKPSSPIVKI